MITLKEKGIQVLDVTPVKQFGEIQYYTAQITVGELAKLHDKITYDGEAQRGKVNGKPLIDHKHVNDIYTAFMNGENIKGHLTWNMRSVNGKSNFEYDEKSKELFIKDNQLITIPDSAHRHSALQLVAENTDDKLMLDSQFTVDIYNISKEEEKELFYTVNGKIKAPHKNRILYLSNELTSKLLRDVIENSNLKGKIECVKRNANGNGKLTKFSTLYDSLFDKTSGVFNKDVITNDTYEEYKNWLIGFYNELLTTREDFSVYKYEEKLTSKQESMLLEEISWWGYAYLAKKLKGDRKWKCNLNKKMNKPVKVNGGAPVHFMDKSLPIWHMTVIKPKYNHITKQSEPGTTVINSNTTRGTLIKVFENELF